MDTGAGNSLTAERVLQTLRTETFTVSVGILNHPMHILQLGFPHLIEFLFMKLSLMTHLDVIWLTGP